jgi:apolipoprotein N-acyltransferase
MNPAGMQSHRGLSYVLLTIFETVFVASIVVTWTIDPRKMRLYNDAAGIAGLFGFVGLLAIWWLLRRVMPRLAKFALLSALLGLLPFMLLPAIP